MKDYVYLQYTDSENNHNKYYQMTLNDNDSIDVKYGRVGGNEREHHYNPNEKDFYQLREDKIYKGYVDVTSLHSVVQEKPSDITYAPIENPDIQNFVTSLVIEARDFIERNYTVTPNEITPKMIEEAESDIRILRDIATNNTDNLCLWRFNQQLQTLFTDIPRKMDKVEHFIAQTKDDFNKIIDREIEMIDNLKGQIDTYIPKDITSMNVLEAYNLSIRNVTYKEEDEITSHLGKDYDGTNCENRYIRGFAVKNNDTQQAYNDFVAKHDIKPKECKLMYHGSKTENWWSIMKRGLSLNPNASTTGKMFGQGLYFAPESRKSLNYMDTKSSCWNNGTRNSGFMAVYSVALGKMYEPNRVLGSKFTRDDLKDGCLSVYASKKNPYLNLKNDEYVVFDQAQTTIKYILEMSDRGKVEEYNLNRKALINTMSQGVDTLIKGVGNTVRAEIRLEDYDLDKYSWGKLLLEACERNNYDVMQLYIDLNTRTNSIELSLSANGDSISTTPYSLGLTTADSRFMARELKKVFCKSEDEWKELTRNISDIQLGTVIKSTNVIEEDKVKHKEKERIA